MSAERRYKSSLSFLVIMTISAVLMDWFWAVPGTHIANAVLDLVSPVLGVALVPFLGKRTLWVDVVIFLMIIPLLLAGFAWVPSVQSEGPAVCLYLFGLIVGANRKQRQGVAIDR